MGLFVSKWLWTVYPIENIFQSGKKSFGHAINDEKQVSRCCTVTSHALQVQINFNTISYFSVK